MSIKKINKRVSYAFLYVTSLVIGVVLLPFQGKSLSVAEADVPHYPTPETNPFLNGTGPLGTTGTNSCRSCYQG